jgi:hypothetical protein
MYRYRRYKRNYYNDPRGFIVLLVLAAMYWIYKFVIEHPFITALIVIVSAVAIYYIIQFFKQRKETKKKQVIVADANCPLCGSKLVEKNGKYGPFTGCSNYPSCKYIKKN